MTQSSTCSPSNPCVERTLESLDTGYNEKRFKCKLVIMWKCLLNTAQCTA